MYGNVKNETEFCHNVWEWVWLEWCVLPHLTAIEEQLMKIWFVTDEDPTDYYQCHSHRQWQSLYPVFPLRYSFSVQLSTIFFIHKKHLNFWKVCFRFGFICYASINSLLYYYYSIFERKILSTLPLNRFYSKQNIVFINVFLYEPFVCIFKQ